MRKVRYVFLQIFWGALWPVCLLASALYPLTGCGRAAAIWPGEAAAQQIGAAIAATAPEAVPTGAVAQYQITAANGAEWQLMAALRVQAVAPAFTVGLVAAHRLLALGAECLGVVAAREVRAAEKTAALVAVFALGQHAGGAFGAGAGAGLGAGGKKQPLLFEVGAGRTTDIPPEMAAVRRAAVCRSFCCSCAHRRSPLCRGPVRCGSAGRRFGAGGRSTPAA